LIHLVIPKRDAAAGHCRVFHSSDAIDFKRFRAGKVGVLGASASAFDNAAVALGAGAAEAHLFVRRPHLPQINKSKWTVFAGFFLGYRGLDDTTRWRTVCPRYLVSFVPIVRTSSSSSATCRRKTRSRVSFKTRSTWRS
jgi:cation diffusion facilitator CzcD-associated flavoprotein CzcO